MDETPAPPEQGAGQAFRPTTTSLPADPADGRGRWPGGIRGALMAILLLAGLGAVAGAIIGLAVASSCNPDDLICIDSGTAASIGAFALGIAGACLGFLGSLVWLLVRGVAVAARHRHSHVHAANPGAA